MPAIPAPSLTLSPNLISCECLWMIAFVRKFCRGWTNQWILLVSSSSDITNPLGYSLVYEYTPPSPFLSLEKGNLLHRFHKSENKHEPLACLIPWPGDVWAMLSLRDWPCDILANSNIPRVKPDGTCDYRFVSVWKWVKLSGIKLASHFIRSYKRLLETLVAFLNLSLPCCCAFPGEQPSPVETNPITFKVFMSQDS